MCLSLYSIALILYVDLTRPQGTQIKHCIWVFANENGIWIDWWSQSMALSNVGEYHSISWGPNRKKRQRDVLLFLCLTTKLEHRSSPALKLGFTLSAPLILRSSDSDLTPPLAFLSFQLTDQIVGLLSLHHGVSQFLESCFIYIFIYTFPIYLFPIGSISLQSIHPYFKHGSCAI